MSMTICSSCGCYVIDQSHCPCESSDKPAKGAGAARALLISSLMGVGLTACDILSPKAIYGVPVYEDLDEDGFQLNEDCDDNDPLTFPGAAELEPDNTLCMADADEDGYGASTPAEGTMGVEPGTDCDDTDPDIHPDATELPGDGVDQNCNGNDED